MEKIFEIALIFTAHDWVEAFHRHCTNTGELKIRALVYDPSALENEQFDACIVSDSYPGLNKAFIDKIHSKSRKVLVVGTTNEASRQFVSELGADAIFFDDVGPQELTKEIVSFLDNVLSFDANDVPTSAFAISQSIQETKTNGQVIAAFGTGGSGCTEISLAIAERLIDNVLIDLDFSHPSLAMRTQREVSPNVLDAIESAQHSPQSFFDAIQQLEKHGLITGVAHSSFARDVRSQEIMDLMDIASSNFANTVLDCGRCDTDSHFANIYESVFNQADVIVISAHATPIGVLRTLENIAYITEVIANTSTKKIFVAMNFSKSRSAMAKQIDDELRTIEAIKSVVFVPYDQKMNEASWNIRSQSKAFKRAIENIVDEINNTPDAQFGDSINTVDQLLESA